MIRGQTHFQYRRGLPNWGLAALPGTHSWATLPKVEVFTTHTLGTAGRGYIYFVECTCGEDAKQKAKE